MEIKVNNLENYNKNKQLIFVGKLTRFGKSRNLDLKNLSIDGGMIKNKFFLQIISNLLEIELNIPEMEDMSSYGALLFGMQYYHNLKNTSDLKDFKVKSSKIIPNIDDTIRNSFISWKEIVDKHFVKNQD